MTPNTKHILSIDQGSSGTKAIIFDSQANLVCKFSTPLSTLYLKEGFVEQDPELIFSNVLEAVEGCLENFRSKGNDPASISCIGISNQRETFVLWDENGKPLYNAISWQCKRSIQICEKLNQNEVFAETVQRNTGLIIDPYFSGTKLKWLRENVQDIKKAIEAKKVYFGTIDTWLLFRLTKGESYLTDYTNASRTLLFNLHDLSWDKSILESLGLSDIILPQAVPSSHYFGSSDCNGLFKKEIPITGMIGDSHAAAFGEGCFSAGTAKATMGTGCSIMMNIGPAFKPSKNGMVTTICWSTENRVDFAMEGIIVSCGATIEWLKNELNLFENSVTTNDMARNVEDNAGVYLIPAFSGLGAPHWQMNRKASISGLTFGVNKNHIVRAALESIPYQIKDIVQAIKEDTGIDLENIMVDGAISSNTFVMEFLASLLKKSLKTLAMFDVSALGAAMIAGLKSGLYKDLDELKKLNKIKQEIKPSLPNELMDRYYGEWKIALSKI
ncbi:FGGY family carbohydrate kinase [Arthrospiribacter ruber]|uniref:glycerol kinase n=1 Tax=Arthrospiribacter ruber TaxID=2487934 RepID=A0A951MD74_9BACT|nr:glycerol kinase GlpK [Arthrospiribacter ruber]MBW3467001.1 glycerol kinase GlpK [Arthrospiribacter ruber]